MNRPVIVVYDIFDDQRRRRIRSHLSLLADRLQQSAWLIPAQCHADPEWLVAGLASGLAPVDRLFAYAPCAACAANARWLPATQHHGLYSPSVWIAG